MTTFELFPNAEEIVIHLLQTADFNGLTPVVASRVPDNADYAAGVITISRIGGIPAERHRLDHPHIQVDAWADTKAKALQLATYARHAIFAAEGTTVSSPDGFISGVDDSLGLTWLFDSVSLRPRYVFGVYLTTHA